VPRRTAAFAGLVAVTLLAAPVRGEERSITCESHKFKYSYCRVDTDNRVTIVRQRSDTRCQLWDNWGYDKRGVWVDRGCGAEFRVGRGGGGDDKAAAAAVAGALIVAAIASHKDHHGDDVPSWAVGTFRGFDENEGVDVELTIHPGGSVSGVAGGNSFSGRWEGDRLQAGRKRFRVERSGNGFQAVDESNRDSRVNFRRSGSGY